MKYVKKFEDISKYKIGDLEYKIGDYILIDGRHYVNKDNKSLKIVRILDWVLS